MSKLSDFNAFEGATQPVSPAAEGAENAVEAPARAQSPKGAAGHPKARERAPEPPPAPDSASVPPPVNAVTHTAAHALANSPAPNLPAAVLKDWQWRLGAAAGRAAATQRRAVVAALAWEGLIALARDERVPELAIVAAAAAAGLPLPDPPAAPA